MIIYKITNLINNKCYIGQTTQKFERRIRAYTKDYIKYKSPLKESIKKHGIKNFKFEIICSVLIKDNLDILEQYFIQYFNSISPNGYNLTLGGQNGQIFTDEVKKRMSKKAKGRPSNMKGRKHTEHTKQLLSEIGKKQPKHALGYKWTDEQKQKLSKSKLGCISHRKKTISYHNIITNETIVFSSLTEAGKYFNQDPSNIRYLLRTNNKPRDFKFSYISG